MHFVRAVAGQQAGTLFHALLDGNWASARASASVGHSKQGPEDPVFRNSSDVSVEGAHLSRPKRAQMARSMRRVGRHMGAAQFFSQSGVTT